MNCTIPTPIKATPSEIRRALQLLLEPEQVAELRVLNTRRGTVSGYFNNLGKLAPPAANLSGQAPGVYVTLNPINPDLLARANNRVREYVKETTSDADILARRWLPIDLDAVRPAGISSTSLEHEAALDKARHVREHLRANGWPEPIYADSGNGAHLLYRVNLANDRASRTVVEGCLKALAFRFDDSAVHVDQGNYNAARIWKCYGTAVCKGDSLPERPHRLACIIEAPEHPAAVPQRLLQNLAVQVPKPSQGRARRPYRGNEVQFDIEHWIAQHDIPILYHGTWNRSDKWILARCIWDPAHTDKSAYILRFANGAIAAGCHHSSCQGRGWAELRELFEPGYQDRRSGTGGAYKRRGRVYLPRVEV